MCEDPLEHLVAAVAEEAVGVEGVVLAVQTETGPALSLVHRLLCGKSDLCGRSAKVQRSHCASARSQPVSRQTILGRGMSPLAIYKL